MKIANWDRLIDFAAHRIGKTIIGRQEEILKSTTQIRIVRAARRTGKSFDAALITYALLCYSTAIGKALNIIYAGPRAEDTRNIWKHLHEMLDTAPIQGLVVLFDNFKSQSTTRKKMLFANGTMIRSATCDNIEMDDIRGDPYDFVVVDEFGNVDHKQAFLDAASQSLKDKDRLNLLMICGTPDLGLGEEFDALFEAGQKGDGKITSWQLTEDDAPFLDEEDAKIMNSLLDDEGRAREVWGEQVVAGGRLFPEFNYATQVTLQTYNPEMPYFIGVDFGRNKPIVEFVQPDGENFRVFYEIRGHDIVVENLVEEIKLVVDAICNGNQPLIVGCDKAGKAKSDLVTFTAFSVLKAAFPMAAFKTGLQLVKKDNQTALYRKITMQNRIFIDPSCKRLAMAFIRATPNVSGMLVKSGWKKVEGIDDPLDALMYGLINYDPGLIIAAKQAPTLSPFERRAKMDAFFGN